MKRILHFIVCISFFMPLISSAQSPQIDSIKAMLAQANHDSIRLRLLTNLSTGLKNMPPDTAEIYAYKAIALAEQLDNKKGKAHALKNLGLAISKKGEEKEAINIFNEGLDIAKAYGYKPLQAEFYRGIGVSYYRIALFDSSLASYFNALKLYTGENDSSGIATILNSIGNVYYFTHRDSTALEYYSRSLDIYKKLDDIKGQASQYGNLGLIYEKLDDLEKATMYSIKSLEYYLKTNDQAEIATSYINLGMVYKEAENYKAALENVTKGLEIRTTLGNKRALAIALQMTGNVYMDMEEYNKALEYYNKALPLCRELDLKVYLYEMLQSIAECYRGLGKYREAAELYDEIIELKDTIYNAETSEKISAMESKYKAEMEAQYQLKEKDTQLKIQELTLKRRSSYLWGAAGFIGLLWVVLGISYIAYRNKQKTNALLARQNSEIKRQKEEITDSIHYAQTIQRAILPPEKLLGKYLPDSFVIFKPKDIVSGDFYWTEKIRDNVYFAAVDCTGHGVPGAFMSIIGHNSLNRAVKDFKLVHPAEILDKLVELVTEALHAENQVEVRDGMDIALCCLDPVQMKLEFAGAYNPVYLFRNNEVLEFKADRQPIGAFEKRKSYTNHEIALEKGDCIYVFSDGIIDQFGGEQGKKLSSKRMKEILLSVAHLSMAQQHVELKKRLEEWQGSHEQTDDITLIGVRV